MALLFLLSEEQRSTRLLRRRKVVDYVVQTARLKDSVGVTV